MVFVAPGEGNICSAATSSCTRCAVIGLLHLDVGFHHHPRPFCDIGFQPLRKFFWRIADRLATFGSQLLLQVGLLNDSAEFVIQSLDNGRRCGARREQSLP